MNQLNQARKGFVKGSTTWNCRSCNKLTRSTGRGDNENVRLCVECYEKAGDENAVSDGNMTQAEFDAKWNPSPLAPPSDNGYKLYNEDDSFFAWFECMEDAETRQKYEKDVFGRSFQIARVTDAEWITYGARVNQGEF